MTSSDLTHDDLVRLGVRWLSRPYRSKKFGYRGSCGVVCPELVTWNKECPDVIGWQSIKRRGTFPRSYVIEAKVSRSDFLSDQKKPHRGRGAGLYRWYLCPTGLILPEDLQDREKPSWGWGLLYTDGKTVRQIAGPELNFRRNHQSEMQMMYSLLRRAEVRGQLSNYFSPRWGGTSRDD